MTRPGITPQSPRSLANTLIIMPIKYIVKFFSFDKFDLLCSIFAIHFTKKAHLIFLYGYRDEANTCNDGDPDSIST